MVLDDVGIYAKSKEKKGIHRKKVFCEDIYIISNLKRYSYKFEYLERFTCKNP